MRLERVNVPLLLTLPAESRKPNALKAIYLCRIRRLQTQRDDFHEWLQGKEELSAAPGTTQRLLQDLRHER